ncbi:hypothetical protein OUZ56_031464 [Daphnia magna]|uniref:Uncharacterized protein n=1 Tax=Daphnia magna TaxID=35525 RepID=A0ABQ9ZUN2_9CRUS|nr:hypothetical protein OUZ56_031464 [Daphnia magna]
MPEMSFLDDISCEAKAVWRNLATNTYVVYPSSTLLKLIKEGDVDLKVSSTSSMASIFVYSFQPSQASFQRDPSLATP